ncbi:hypothetical protein [Actinoplanes siamensis]|nr:hypothetical protein [Actinoplanes siamensis]
MGLLHDIAAMKCPPVDLRRAEVRWADYVDQPAAAEELAGSSLLHTDWNDTNVLISDRARLVDWGWATRGAPWLDPALWVIWLIASGHSPSAAEQWAGKVATWSSGSPESVTRFASANARFWASEGERTQDAWTLRLVNASASWAAHRRSLEI